VSKHIYPLEHRNARRVAECGQKSATLSRLNRQGINVPGGFVISNKAFSPLKQHIKAALQDQKSTGDGTNLESVRQRVMAYQFPPAYTHAITKNLAKIDSAVAVRSSLIGEDSQYTSMAGQLNSYLDITEGADLFRAIKACFASQFNDRILRYLSGSKLSTGVDRLIIRDMAVLVQRMIPSVLSGVIFSTDPNSSEPRIVVEAAPHAGSVVGGHAIPDRYYILPDGTTVTDLINDPNRPLLDEIILQEIGRTTRTIVDILGCPQDIEWVWDGNQFHILQARPITTLHERHVYSRRMVAEMSPGLIKPLLWSTNIRDMNYNVFGKLFSKLTWQKDLDFTPMTRLIRSRVYADMTFIGNILTLTGLPENFFESIGRGEEVNRPRLKLRLVFILNTLRCLPFLVRLMRPADEIYSFIQRHQTRHARHIKTDWSQRSPESMLPFIYRQRKFHGETQWYMWITALNMSLRSRMLTRFVRRHIPGADPNRLLSGMKDLMGMAPNREIERIALTARQLLENDLEQFRSCDNTTIRAMLTSTETGRKILTKVDRFMRQYGFLSTSGTDFTVPPWSETPEMIWRLIYHAAGSPKNSDAKINHNGGEHETDSFYDQIAPWKYHFYHKLLAGTKKYISLRDKVSFAMARDSFIMRTVYLQLGRHLVRDGHLVLPEDIFYLYFDELTNLVQRNISDRRIRQRIARRKKELAEDERIVVPETVSDSESMQTDIHLSHKDQSCLEGIPGSPGMITGFARVVHAPEVNGDQLTKDDILVVPFTDVGWTPLFSVVGGIVAESGGQLSHSSIIAREYGLPAVVGVRDATRLIRDGQEITVDGTSGRVYL